MEEQSKSLEHAVLSILQDSKKPLGASALSLALESLGVEISMATAGRLLWALEQKGYVQQVSNKGRILSEKGIALVREWNQEEHQRSLAETFFQTLQGHSPEQLLDVLLARRAIERETSRLAALRGTEEDIAKILTYGDILDNHTRGNTQVAVMDRTFHESIAEAAKNKVLAAALRLVRQNAAIRNLFVSIRAQGEYVLGGDHQAIAQAIARKDPRQAEEAMLQHIDNLIRDVQTALRSEA